MTHVSVILLGDSIRLHVQPLVVERLGSAFAVWGTEENGGTSANVLAHLDEWAIQHPADVIHINCGLHDLAFERDTGYRVPIGEYERNVRSILERLQTETAARVVWATTTPVIDAWHAAQKSFDRREADVERYNRVATSVSQRMNITINDLWSVIENSGKAKCLLPDGVHMNPRGNDLLAEAVVVSVRTEAGRLTHTLI